MNEIKLSTFPSTYTEALTMLYLQNQDLSNKTPTEIYELYNKVKKEISSAKADKSLN